MRRRAFCFFFFRFAEGCLPFVNSDTPHVR